MEIARQRPDKHGRAYASIELDFRGNCTLKRVTAIRSATRRLKQNGG